MKLLILHNIATSYYKNIVFNELYKNFKDFKVIHLAETQSNRAWKIDLSYLEYPYKVLFEGKLDEIPKIKLIKRLLDCLKKQDYDVILLGGYSIFAYWVALVYSKMKNKIVVLEMDSNMYNIGKIRFFKEILKKFFIKLCDYGLTYSNLSEKYFVSLGMKKENIFIKPNVTDNNFWIKELEKYRREREKIIKENGFKKYNFLYVGRFSKEKNLFFLLESFEEVKKSGDKRKNDWGLILVGSGPLEENLKKFVKEKSIEDVFFVGFKQKEDLPMYYAISDALILPSISEPWGIVVNEAMASGLIPVVSNRCGASDLVDEKNGFIFNPVNKKELIMIMKKIKEEYYKIKSMKELNRDKIKEFTAEYAARKIIQLIEKIKDNKNI